MRRKWYSLWNTPTQRHDIKGELVEKYVTPYQTIEIIDTEDFGRCMLLDGEPNMSEVNFSEIHESLIHFPIASSRAVPKKVLIVGGGDGGSILELLKYKDIDSITIVELDGDVIKVCKNYYPFLNHVWDDPRVNLIVGDGVKFLKESNEYFDLIISDVTGTRTHDELHKEGYFKLVLGRLSDEGVGCGMIESIDFQRDTFVNSIKYIKNNFEYFKVFKVWIPFYAEFMGRAVYSKSQLHSNPQFFEGIECNWINRDLFNSSFGMLTKEERRFI